MRLPILALFFCCTSVVNADLLDESSVPVVWGIATTATSMQLGNYASLRFAAHSGHPLIVYIEEQTAFMDPSGGVTQPGDNSAIAEKNSPQLQAQIKTLFPNARIYVQSKENKLPFKQLLLDGQGLTINPGSQTVAEAMYPLLFGYEIVNMAKKYRLKQLIVAGGEDQRFNLNTANHLLKQNGIEGQTLINGLLLDPTGEKMGKSSGAAIFLNDPDAISQYIGDLPDEDVPYTWNLLGNGEMPVDPIDARKQLTAQLTHLLPAKS